MNEVNARKQMEVYAKNGISELNELIQMLKGDDNDLVDIGFKLEKINHDVYMLKETLDFCEDY